MADATTLISIAAAAAGVVAKSLWDSFVGYRDSVRLEGWKIKVATLEQRLSNFYWPLYSRLQRDDLIWEKVFYDLQPDNRRPKPDWIKYLSNDQRQNLRTDIEKNAIIPNHIEAVRIIRENMHLANADASFSKLVSQYVRHVDVYSSLRSASIFDVDPIAVGEPYPPNFSKTVELRLRRYEDEYERLLQNKNVLDLSTDAVITTSLGTEQQST